MNNEKDRWQEWDHEVFVLDGKIVLIGEPSDNHSCDEMGCSSIHHVVARAEVYLTDWTKK